MSTRYSLRWLFTGLAGQIAATLCLASAFAGVQIPEPSPVEGDGRSTVMIPILSNAQGLRITAKTDIGSVAVSHLNGMPALQFTPPVASKDMAATLSVKIRGGEKADITVNVPIQPAWTPGFKVSFDPPQLGPGQSTTLRVTANTAGPIGNDKRTPQISASIGTVTALVPDKGNTWVAKYTAPKESSLPQQVAFAVVDAHAPLQSYGSAHLPIVVDKNITLETTADSSNVLTVGDRSYGPRKASPTGRVSFKMSLHPEYGSGTLETVASDGSKSSKTVELPSGSKAGLVLHPIVANLRAAEQYTIHASCFMPSGAACTEGEFKLRTQNGQETVLSPASGNLLASTITSPNSPGKERIKAEGAGETVSIMIEISPEAGTLALSADTTEITSGSAVSIDSKYTSKADGKALTTMPYLHAFGSRVKRSPKQTTAGEYRSQWQTDEDAKSFVWVAAPPALSKSGPATRLVLVPITTETRAGGLETVLAAAAIDAYGNPTPNVSMSITLTTGNGALSPLISGKEAGISLITYRPGPQPGYVHLTATAGDLKASAVLYQAAEGQATFEVPPSGSSIQIQDAQRLRQLIAVHGAKPAQVVQETPAPGVATGPTVAPTAAPVANTSAPVTSAQQSTPPSSGNWMGTGAQPTTRMLRLRYGFGISPLQYSSKTKTGGLEDFPPTSKFSVTPIALAGEAELWMGPDRNIGIAASAGVGFYALTLGDPDEASFMAPIRLNVGGRYRIPISSGPVSAWAGLAVTHNRSLVIKYSDESRTSGIPVARSVWGVQPSGGIRAEWKDWLLESAISSNFAPVPDFGAIARIEWRLRGAITVGVSASFNARLLLLKNETPEAKFSVTELNETFLAYSGLVF